jgi:hypothetical protein
MTNLSTATTSHEHYKKIAALPKFRRHLGTLGTKTAAVSSARIVTFIRSYTASHFTITYTPETWLHTNRKSHKWLLCGFYYGISYKRKNRSSSGIVPSLYTFHPEISILLGFYPEYNGRFLPTLRDTLSVSFSTVMFVCLLKIGLMGCTKTSVRKQQSTLRKIPKVCRFHLHRDGSLKSHIFYLHIFSSVLVFRLFLCPTSSILVWVKTWLTIIKYRPNIIKKNRQWQKCTSKKVNNATEEAGQSFHPFKPPGTRQ